MGKRYGQFLNKKHAAKLQIEGLESGVEHGARFRGSFLVRLRCRFISNWARL